jgi:hypothetical protein
MTTYTLRPNGNWTGSADFTIAGGAGSAHAAVSDDTNGTYVQKTSSAATPKTIAFDLGTTTLSATETVNYVTVRAKMTQGSTGRLLASLGYISDRTAKTTSYSQSIEKRGTVSSATIDFALNLTTAPDGTAWSQTKIDDLVVRFIDYGAGGDRAQIIEVYVDVVTTSKPTVTVTAPTGTQTDTSFPTVTWTYADTDNAPQTAFRVKVFTAAQYNASGFLPETSTATVDSQEIISSDPGYTLGTDLANATTYRAYVKVAKTVNDVYYFSDWAFSGFSLSLDAPGVPILSASFNGTTRSVSLTIQGTTNLLTANEASIESSAGGWVSDSNTTVARTTGQFNDGAASLSFTANSAANMVVRLAGTYNVLAGQSYAAIGSFKANSTGRSVAVGIRWIDSSSATISESYGTNVTDSSSAWTSATVVATAPTNAVTARVLLKVTSPANGEVHFVDSIAFHPGTTAAFTIGGYSSLTFVVERTSDGSYVGIRNSPVTAGVYQSASLTDYESNVGGVSTYRVKARGTI